jgi:hypothetical protein
VKSKSVKYGEVALLCEWCCEVLLILGDGDGGSGKAVTCGLGIATEGGKTCPTPLGSRVVEEHPHHDLFPSRPFFSHNM